ncbi:MAG: hypothetical protein COA36_12685 [Desulfotalea sp.]|nr:MAG: hypothetical protein COA36_12685 [Desulfotalea sp.]
MSKTRLTSIFQRFGATLFLFPFFLGGCSLFSQETRYAESTRTYNYKTSDTKTTSPSQAGAVRYHVKKYGSATAHYTANGNIKAHKYTNRTGGKRYSIGRHAGVTDYYTNRQRNNTIEPGDRQFDKQQENYFPRDMTPAEQRASLPLVIEISDVLFEFDKWVIKSTYVPELERWVDYFKNNPLVTADIYGYADSTGPEGYNQKLSEQRAIAVVNYMVERGVNPKNLSTKGFGENQPAAPNDTQEGRQKNRRVELNF